MIKKLKEILSINNSIKETLCSFEEIPSNLFFVLQYEKDEIGFLSYREGVWKFEYSPWFKTQNDLDPLFEFPDVNKLYESKSLWPFFSSRIPSDKQPKMQRFYEKNPKKVDNLGALLAEFGKTTVNNPFKLMVCI